MRARGVLAGCLVVLGFAAGMGDASAAHWRRAHLQHANGPTVIGPWVDEGWYLQDWSHAPSVRDWGWSAPWHYPITGYPTSDEWYPWGYTTPFVRIGNRCISSEFNRSPGGALVRYQRVRPSYYCN